MIDFYDIELSFPLDHQAYRNVPGHQSPNSPRRTHRFFLNCSDWMSKQEVIVGPDVTRLRVCPPKVLGRWNCWGSDDLRRVVASSAPLVLSQLGHCVTDEQEAEIARGSYRIREVHVAQSFHLVNYSQSEFVRRLFYALGDFRRPQWARRGTGFFINPLNRRVCAYIYAKLEEFEARGLKAYASKVDRTHVHRRWAVVLDRRQQYLGAALGPRLEFRFGDQFFRHHLLQTGSNWKPGTARILFDRELKRLDLPATIGVMFDRDRAQALLTPAQFSTLRLWHHGEPMAELASASTVKRHRAAIREALGIDIAHPSSTLVGVGSTLDVGAVLSADNLVGTPDLDDEDSQDLLYRLHNQRKSGAKG